MTVLEDLPRLTARAMSGVDPVDGLAGLPAGPNRFAAANGTMAGRWPSQRCSRDAAEGRTGVPCMQPALGCRDWGQVICRVHVPDPARIFGGGPFPRIARLATSGQCL